MPARRASSSRSTKPGTTARCCSAARSSGSALEPRLRVDDAAGDGVAERTWPAGGLDHRSATQRDLWAGRASCWPDGRCWRSAIASSMAGMEFAAPVRDRRRRPGDARRAGAAGAAAPAAQSRADRGDRRTRRRIFRRSPASTRPSIAASRTSPRPSPCRASSATAGVRRYGFHGLSYDYVVSAAARDGARDRADRA